MVSAGAGSGNMYRHMVMAYLLLTYYAPARWVSMSMSTVDFRR